MRKAGGYISIVDQVTGEYSYFSAPEKFKGDLSDFRSGALSFDLRISASSTNADQRDIIFQNSNNGREISYKFDEQPIIEWKNFSVTMNPAENWLNGNEMVATDEDFDAVLQKRYGAFYTRLTHFWP